MYTIIYWLKPQSAVHTAHNVRHNDNFTVKFNVKILCVDIPKHKEAGKGMLPNVLISNNHFFLPRLCFDKIDSLDYKRHLNQSCDSTLKLPSH